MAMEIQNNPGVCSAGKTSILSTQNSDSSKGAVVNSNSEKTHRSTSEYKKYLSDNFDCLKAKGYSVQMNSSLVAKAANDEKTAKWLEENLSLIPDAYSKMTASAAERGCKVLSCNIRINGYDDMTTEIVTQDVVDTGTDKLKKGLEEQIKKIREEKKAESKKLKEKAAAKKAKEKQSDKSANASDRTSNYSVTSDSIEKATQSMMSALKMSSATDLKRINIKA